MSTYVRPHASAPDAPDVPSPSAPARPAARAAAAGPARPDRGQPRRRCQRALRAAAAALAVTVPATVLALPLHLLASDLNLADTVWSVLIPVLFTPFGVHLGRMSSASYVPDEVLEAARTDGVNELRGFFSVGLWMMAPGYVTIFLFQLTGIWNNFFLPLVMLSDASLHPLSLGLYSWNAAAPVNPDSCPLTVIGSLPALLPLVIAFLLLQRYRRSGLTGRSVKERAVAHGVPRHQLLFRMPQLKPNPPYARDREGAVAVGPRGTSAVRQSVGA